MSHTHGEWLDRIRGCKREEKTMHNKTVHDKRPYYDRRIEPLVGPEWDRANEADEKEQYYWAQMFNGGRCVKKYKPSVAELVRRRTKLAIEPWRGEERG